MNACSMPNPKRRIIGTISKRAVAEIFGYINPDGSLNRYMMRRYVFTDEFVTQKLGMTLEDFRKRQSFTFQETKIIVEAFDITENDFQ